MWCNYESYVQWQYTMTGEFSCQPVFTSQDIIKISALILYILKISSTLLKQLVLTCKNKVIQTQNVLISLKIKWPQEPAISGGLNFLKICDLLDSILSSFCSHFQNVFPLLCITFIQSPLESSISDIPSDNFTFIIVFSLMVNDFKNTNNSLAVLEKTSDL